MKFKKVLLTVFVVGLLFILCAITSFAATTGTVNVGSGNLNMRSGAGTSYSIAASVPNGSTVTILETVSGTDSSASAYPTWYKITYGGKTGYVASKYIVNIKTDAVSDASTDEDVPAIYKTYVETLKAAHPNWSFEFYNTGLNWSDVLAGESKLGISAISGSRPISYRSTTVNYNADATQTGTISGSDGELNIRSEPSSAQGNKTIIAVLKNGTTVQLLGASGNWYHIRFTYNGQTLDGYAYNKYITNIVGAQVFEPVEGSSWYQAHGQVIQYYMDPRNSMSNERIFQFEKLSYDTLKQTLSGVQSILSGSFMDGAYITTTDNRSITYAQAFMEAASKYNVSPYHLASRVLQEVGKTSPSVAATGAGYNGEYVGIFNFYNIGANTGVKDGLDWAYNNNQPGSYGTPWNTQYKSIMGGAEYIASKYINVGQNSLYFQKFDVIKNGGLYNHQYMTNIEAVYSESTSVYKGYNNLGLLNSSFVFVIPVYNNMPAAVCALPASSSSPNMLSDTYVTPDIFVEPTPTPDPEPTPDIIKGGDVNGDGKLQITDARRILMYITGGVTLTDAQKYEADVTGDGEVRITDARTILKMITSGQQYVAKS